MNNASIPEVNMLENSSTLAASVPRNLSVKLGFVSENGPRETYFVDAPRSTSVCSNANPLHYYALWVPHKADRWHSMWLEYLYSVL